MFIAVQVLELLCPRQLVSLACRCHLVGGVRVAKVAAAPISSAVLAVRTSRILTCGGRRTERFHEGSPAYCRA